MLEKLNEEFLNQYTDNWADSFEDYFENQRVSRIRLRHEYKEIEKAICEIKDKHTKVINFLEDEEIVKLNDEEEKAIIEILNLQEEINMIELKESFKLGFKEAYIYFKSMDMLKI